MYVWKFEDQITHVLFENYGLNFFFKKKLVFKFNLKEQLTKKY